MGRREGATAATSVLVNALPLTLGGGLVVGRSLLEFLPLTSPSLRVIALIPPDCGYEDVCARSGAEYQVIRPRGPAKAWRVYLDNVVVPGLSKRYRADVVLSLGNSGPIRLDRPHLLVLQNAFLAFGADGMPGWTRRDKVSLWIQQQLFHRAAKHASLVLPQTKAVARELVRRRIVLPSQTWVIPNGITFQGLGTRVPESITTKMDRLQGRLKLLFVAYYYPHKNFEYILDVAAALPAEVRRKVAFLLTVDPEQHRLAGKTLDQVESRGLSDVVVNIGPVPHAALPSLYGATDAVFFPSLLESYSGSYLEAMQHGKPILTSDREFAREPCASAPLYFDPCDVTSGVEAVERFAGDPLLREKLSRASRLRLAELPRSTWREVAAQYKAAIDHACSLDRAKRQDGAGSR